MDKWVEGGVAMAVFFLLAGVLILPNFAETQGELDSTIDEVFTTSEWEDVINTSASSDYTVSNDTVTLTGSSGVIQTEMQRIESHDRLEINVSHLAADTDVTVYNSNGTSVTSTTISGDTDATIEITDISTDNYYVEYAASTATDSEVDGYTITAFDQVDNQTQTLMYLVLLLFMVGIALGVYSKYT
jgi:hypothetical protein